MAVRCFSAPSGLFYLESEIESSHKCTTENCPISCGAEVYLLILAGSVNSKRSGVFPGQRKTTRTKQRFLSCWIRMNKQEKNPNNKIPSGKNALKLLKNLFLAYAIFNAFTFYTSCHYEKHVPHDGVGHVVTHYDIQLLTILLFLH